MKQDVTLHPNVKFGERSRPTPVLSAKFMIVTAVAAECLLNLAKGYGGVRVDNDEGAHVGDIPGAASETILSRMDAALIRVWSGAVAGEPLRFDLCAPDHDNFVAHGMSQPKTSALATGDTYQGVPVRRDQASKSSWLVSGGELNEAEHVHTPV